MSIRFSVIVPTRNRRAQLQASLDCLVAQTFPAHEFEVIVVDDGSTDGTVDWLERQATTMRLRVVRTDHGGPGAARNAGAAVAVGEYLAFTEDDVLIAPDWLERADAHLRQNPIDLLEGRTRLEGTLRSTRRGEPVPVPSFIPCNLFVRRSAFDDLGGYDLGFFDRGTGLYFREDVDLGFRAFERGYVHEIDPTVLVEHPEQFLTMRACFRHARRYVFDPLLYRRHPALYRKFIEVKTFGRLRIHRPLHLVALGSLMAWVLVLIGALTASVAALAIGVALLLISGIAVRAKYQGRRALHIWNVTEVAAFTCLPIAYLEALTRGCVRARGGLGVFV